MRARAPMRRRAAWRSMSSACPRARPDMREESKGPRVGAPEQPSRVSCGRRALPRSTRRGRERPQEGRILCRGHREARPRARDIVAEIMPEISATSPGRNRCAGARPRPEPARSAALGPAAAVDHLHLRAGDRGARDRRFRGRRHRRRRRHAMAIASTRRDEIKVRRFDDYVAKLDKAPKSCSTPTGARHHPRRRENLAFAQGLELIEDEGLLEEVAGLVEWPVVLMGEFEEAFLAIPAEVIRADDPGQPEMLRAARRGRTALQPLHPRLQHRGQGRRPGSSPATARRARAPVGRAVFLGDATRGRCRTSHDTRVRPKFGLDLGKPLDQRMAKLAHLDVVFHEKLGTQGERVERIARSRARSRRSSAPMRTRRRARRCWPRPIFFTEVVGEFPETAGADGPALCGLQGEDPEVAAAIEEHYKPRPGRPRADRSGVGRGGAGRQARHARRLLGDRREADRFEGPLCAAPRGARRDPSHPRERRAREPRADFRRGSRRAGCASSCSTAALPSRWPRTGERRGDRGRRALSRRAPCAGRQRGRLRRLRRDHRQRRLHPAERRGRSPS